MSNEVDLFKVTQINASIARATIRMEGMKVENQERFRQGLSLTYNEEEFLKIIDEEGIGFNQVINVWRA